ncbi:MAG: hypothetical protein ACRD8Z_14745 [Nitrososphaeraceae archaeon]
MNNKLIPTSILVVVASISFNLMLVYAQPIEENWQNVPSHAVNGEIELFAIVNTSGLDKELEWYEAVPKGTSLPELYSISFDVKNVTGNEIKFENETSFYFNPEEGLLWEGMAQVTVDNQTFRKPYTLELFPSGEPPKSDEFGYYSHLLTGSLRIGSNLWNPVSGWVYTYLGDDEVTGFNIWSYVDHIPDPNNNP